MRIPRAEIKTPTSSTALREPRVFITTEINSRHLHLHAASHGVAETRAAIAAEGDYDKARVRRCTCAFVAIQFYTRRSNLTLGSNYTFTQQCRAVYKVRRASIAGKPRDVSSATFRRYCALRMFEDVFKTRALQRGLLKVHEGNLNLNLLRLRIETHRE